MVCAGQPVTLHDATAGGTWATGPSSIATIDGSGVLWGVSSGTVIVSYTVGTGCSVISSIIINPLSPITGNGGVCAGQSITLTDTTEGGTWSSGNTAVATAVTETATTGLITGAATAGTVTVTYTLATGCAASAMVTVNPAPPAPGGLLGVCAGSTTTLSDGITGGVWSSGNTGIATVNGTTGVAGGVASGIAAITYTLAGTGCPALGQVTVNPLPPAIGGPSLICTDAAEILADGGNGRCMDDIVHCCSSDRCINRGAVSLYGWERDRHLHPGDRVRHNRKHNDSCAATSDNGATAHSMSRCGNYLNGRHGRWQLEQQRPDRGIR